MQPPAQAEALLGLQHTTAPCGSTWQVLYSVAELVKNYCVIYLVDTSEVPDFNTMYELYDPCTVMFFYRNKVRRHSRPPLPPLPGQPESICHPACAASSALPCRLRSTS
jgi:hypothetical protein